MPYEASQAAIDNLMGEIHALNSKIQVIAQRMKIIERNEEIIGKTLISHNKMLKGIEDEVNSLKAGSVPAEAAPNAGPEMAESVSEIKGMFRESKKQVDQNRKEIDLIKAELNEMKYVLDAINPVAYATVDQVADLVDEKITDYMRKKKG